METEGKVLCKLCCVQCNRSALPCAARAPQVKKEGKAKFKLGVAEAKLGSAIQVGGEPAVLCLLAPAVLCCAATPPWPSGCRTPDGRGGRA